MKKEDSRHDILGDRAETDKGLPEGTRATSNFRGDVVLVPQPASQSLDADLCRTLEEACPPNAIAASSVGGRPELTLDKGKCIMCGICQEMAPSLFKIQSRFAQPVNARSDLVVARMPMRPSAGLEREEMGTLLSDKIKRRLGRSLAIREVDAGSCNGCEVEVSALNNPIYDIERFGVHFVASPRHADLLLVTGVGSRNMESALMRTYEATPDPKVVVAVGACACTGGIFDDTYASAGGISGVVPVDVYVPGCPPRPEALLYALLLAVDRVR